MVVSLIPYAFYLAALAICGLCYWKGDRPLKLAAAVILIGWTLSPIVSHPNRHGWDFPVTILDTNAAIVLVWVSARWRMLWCAVLAAMTILIALLPLVAVANRDVHRNAFLGANNVMAVFQLLILLLALWITARARRRADEASLQL